MKEKVFDTVDVLKFQAKTMNQINGIGSCRVTMQRCSEAPGELCNSQVA